MSEENPGFLSRWSRRKLEARQDLPLAEPAQPEPADDTPPAPITTAPAPVPATPAAVAQPTEERPPLTLDDVAALTRDSDFSLFVGKDVAPEVKNAAMKKLFTDPHYNIMDGLDTYIDDYSHPEVMPQSMLRKMASARVLNLFTDEDEAKAVAEDERLAALAAPDDAANAVEPAAAADEMAEPLADNPPINAAEPGAAGISHAADTAGVPGYAGDKPDHAPRRSMLESDELLDPSATGGLLSVPTEPGRQ